MTTSPSLRTSALLAWCWLGILLVTTGLLAWHSLSDRDVWLHSRVGHDLLATGHVPTTNTYSFTVPDAPWLNHEWAFQVVVAALGPRGEGAVTDADVTGWNVLRVALAVGLVLALLLGDGGRARLRGRRTGGALLGAGIGLSIALGLLWTRLILRPELVSYLFFAVVLRQVEFALGSDAALGTPSWHTWLDPRRPGGRALVASLLWTQCHGFAAAAPVLWLLGLVAALLGPALRTDHEVRRPGAGRVVVVALGGTILAVAALAVSPNGLAGLAYPLHALGQFGGDRPDLGGVIAELVPLLETTNALGATLLIFRLSLVWGTVWVIAQWGRIPLLRILVWLAMIAFALSGQRGLGPYAVAFMLLHTAPALGPRAPWSRWCAGPGRRAWLAPGGSLALFVILIGLFWPRVVDDRFYLAEGVTRRFGGGLTPAHAPVESAHWLADHGAARVVANLDAAGCLLAGSRARLWIDGRTEAYPPAAWRAYAVLRRGGAAALELLNRDRPDAVCVTTGGAVAPLAQTLVVAPAWRLAHAGDAATVFVRSDDPTAGVSPSARAVELLARAGRTGGRSARRADLCLAASVLQQLDGNEDAALAALRLGAVLRPDHAVLRHNLGTALLAREQFAAARTEFLTALDTNPRLAEAATNAGVCALALGEPTAAEQAFRRALAISPRQFQAWANLGGLLARRGDTAGALEAVSRALELQPNDSRLRAARDRLRAEARHR